MKKLLIILIIALSSCGSQKNLMTYESQAHRTSRKALHQDNLKLLWHSIEVGLLFGFFVSTAEIFPNKNK